MVIVEPGMVVPVLPIVIEALQSCGASSVHERTLEMLNLFYVGFLPGGYVEAKASLLQSAAADWIVCTVQYIRAAVAW